MTKHDNTDKDLAGAERSGHSVDPKEAHRRNQNPWYSMGRRYDYDEAMELFPFSLVSPSTKSKADTSTSQDTIDDTSESKNKPLHECDDMDKSRTEKERYDGTSKKKKRKGCCICMGCFPCCGGEEEEWSVIKVVTIEFIIIFYEWPVSPEIWIIS